MSKREHVRDGGESRDPRRLLVLGPNKPFLGAQLVQIPFLAELRSKYPQSRITLALPFRAPSAFEQFRFHNELVCGYATSAPHTARFLADSAVRRYGRVYSLRAHSARAGMVALMTGARRRIGYHLAVNRLFFNEKVPPRNDVYLALKYLDLLGDGGPWCDLPPVDLWTPEIALGVTALLVERGIRSPFVGILVGAGGERKRWPVDRFLTLAEKLRAEFSGVEVLYFFSPEEASGQIGEQLAGVDSRMKFCFGDLRFLACALSRCAAVVSSDCGPAHFGHLVGNAQVTLFDSTGRPHEWFLPRPGATYVMAGDGQPVSSIGVGEVMAAVRPVVRFGLG